MGSNRLGSKLLSLALLKIVILYSWTYAFSQTPFYQGKTLTILAASPAGGSGDLRIKAAVPFLRKHIPGNPTIVIDYMPGGGGRKLANHLYQKCPAGWLDDGQSRVRVCSRGDSR